jgi:hypothetical protein
MGMILGASFLCGQGALSADRVQVEFQAFALPPIAHLYFRAAPGEAPVRMRFYSSEATPWYRYQGPRQLPLWNDPDGTETVATLDLATAPRRFLLILVPEGESPRLRPLVVSAALDGMPPSHVRLVNTTGSSYRLSFDRRDVLLSPGVGPNLPLLGRVDLALSVWTRQQWRPCGEVELELGAKNRGWLILFPPRRPGELYPVMRVLYEKVGELASDPSDEASLEGQRVH